MTTTIEKRLVKGEINRETEKAWLVEIEIDTPTGLRGWKVWLPKSQCELTDEGFAIPEWLIEAKERDIVDYVHRSGFWAMIITN